MTTPPASPVTPVGASAAGGSITWMRAAFLFYSVVLLFAVGFAAFSGGIKTLFGEGPPRLQALLAGLAIGLALVAGTRISVRIWKPMATGVETASRLVGPLGLREALALALLSGVAEELLFRGALWPTLGLLGTTLLFGLVHVVPKRELWVYPLFAAVAGLLLGLLREGTLSVLPPMLAHVLVNAFNLHWLGARARARAAAAIVPPAPPAPPSPPPSESAAP